MSKATTPVKTSTPSIYTPSFENEDPHGTWDITGSDKVELDKALNDFADFHNLSKLVKPTETFVEKLQSESEIYYDTSDTDNPHYFRIFYTPLVQIYMSIDVAKDWIGGGEDINDPEEIVNFCTTAFNKTILIGVPTIVAGNTATSTASLSADAAPDKFAFIDPTTCEEDTMHALALCIYSRLAFWLETILFEKPFFGFNSFSNCAGIDKTSGFQILSGNYHKTQCILSYMNEFAGRICGDLVSEEEIESATGDINVQNQSLRSTGNFEPILFDDVEKIKLPAHLKGSSSSSSGATFTGKKVDGFNRYFLSAYVTEEEEEEESKSSSSSSTAAASTSTSSPKSSSSSSSSASSSSTSTKAKKKKKTVRPKPSSPEEIKKKNTQDFKTLSKEKKKLVNLQRFENSWSFTPTPNMRKGFPDAQLYATGSPSTIPDPTKKRKTAKSAKTQTAVNWDTVPIEYDWCVKSFRNGNETTAITDVFMGTNYAATWVNLLNAQSNVFLNDGFHVVNYTKLSTLQAPFTSALPWISKKAQVQVIAERGDTRSGRCFVFNPLVWKSKIPFQLITYIYLRTMYMLDEMMWTEILDYPDLASLSYIGNLTSTPAGELALSAVNALKQFLPNFSKQSTSSQTTESSSDTSDGPNTLQDLSDNSSATLSGNVSSSGSSGSSGTSGTSGSSNSSDSSTVSQAISNLPPIRNGKITLPDFFGFSNVPVRKMTTKEQKNFFNMLKALNPNSTSHFPEPNKLTANQLALVADLKVGKIRTLLTFTPDGTFPYWHLTAVYLATPKEISSFFNSIGFDIPEILFPSNARLVVERFPTGIRVFGCGFQFTFPPGLSGAKQLEFYGTVRGISGFQLASPDSFNLAANWGTAMPISVEVDMKDVGVRVLAIPKITLGSDSSFSSRNYEWIPTISGTLDLFGVEIVAEYYPFEEIFTLSIDEWDKPFGLPAKLSNIMWQFTETPKNSEFSAQLDVGDSFTLGVKGAYDHGAAGLIATVSEFGTEQVCNLIGKTLGFTPILPINLTFTDAELQLANDDVQVDGIDLSKGIKFQGDCTLDCSALLKKINPPYLDSDSLNKTLSTYLHIQDTGMLLSVADESTTKFSFLTELPIFSKAPKLSDKQIVIFTPFKKSGSSSSSSKESKPSFMISATLSDLSLCPPGFKSISWNLPSMTGTIFLIQGRPSLGFTLNSPISLKSIIPPLPSILDLDLGKPVIYIQPPNPDDIFDGVDLEHIGGVEMPSLPSLDISQIEDDMEWDQVTFYLETEIGFSFFSLLGIDFPQLKVALINYKSSLILAGVLEKGLVVSGLPGITISCKSLVATIWPKKKYVALALKSLNVQSGSFSFPDNLDFEINVSFAGVPSFQILLTINSDMVIPNFTTIQSITIGASFGGSATPSLILGAKFKFGDDKDFTLCTVLVYIAAQLLDSGFAFDVRNLSPRKVFKFINHVFKTSINENLVPDSLLFLNQFSAAWVRVATKINGEILDPGLTLKTHATILAKYTVICEGYAGTEGIRINMECSPFSLGPVKVSGFLSKNVTVLLDLTKTNVAAGGTILTIDGSIEFLGQVIKGHIEIGKTFMEFLLVLSILGIRAKVNAKIDWGGSPRIEILADLSTASKNTHAKTIKKIEKACKEIVEQAKKFAKTGKAAQQTFGSAVETSYQSLKTMQSTADVAAKNMAATQAQMDAAVDDSLSSITGMLGAAGMTPQQLNQEFKNYAAKKMAYEASRLKLLDQYSRLQNEYLEILKIPDQMQALVNQMVAMQTRMLAQIQKLVQSVSSASKAFKDLQKVKPPKPGSCASRASKRRYNDWKRKMEQATAKLSKLKSQMAQIQRTFNVSMTNYNTRLSTMMTNFQRSENQINTNLHNLKNQINELDDLYGAIDNMGLDDLVHELSDKKSELSVYQNNLTPEYLQVYTDYLSQQNSIENTLSINTGKLLKLDAKLFDQFQDCQYTTPQITQALQQMGVGYQSLKKSADTGAQDAAENIIHLLKDYSRKLPKKIPVPTKPPSDLPNSLVTPFYEFWSDLNESIHESFIAFDELVTSCNQYATKSVVSSRQQWILQSIPKEQLRTYDSDTLSKLHGSTQLESDYNSMKFALGFSREEIVSKIVTTHQMLEGIKTQKEKVGQNAAKIAAIEKMETSHRAKLALLEAQLTKFDTDQSSETSHRVTVSTVNGTHFGGQTVSVDTEWSWVKNLPSLETMPTLTFDSDSDSDSDDDDDSSANKSSTGSSSGTTASTSASPANSKSTKSPNSLSKSPKSSKSNTPHTIHDSPKNDHVSPVLSKHQVSSLAQKSVGPQALALECKEKEAEMKIALQKIKKIPQLIDKLSKKLSQAYQQLDSKPLLLLDAWIKPMQSFLASLDFVTTSANLLYSTTYVLVKHRLFSIQIDEMLTLQQKTSVRNASLPAPVAPFPEIKAPNLNIVQQNSAESCFNKPGNMPLPFLLGLMPASSDYSSSVDSYNETICGYINTHPFSFRLIGDDPLLGQIMHLYSMKFTGDLPEDNVIASLESMTHYLPDPKGFSIKDSESVLNNPFLKSFSNYGHGVMSKNLSVFGTFCLESSEEYAGFFENVDEFLKLMKSSLSIEKLQKKYDNSVDSGAQFGSSLAQYLIHKINPTGDLLSSAPISHSPPDEDSNLASLTQKASQVYQQGVKLLTANFSEPFSHYLSVLSTFTNVSCFSGVSAQLIRNGYYAASTHQLAVDLYKDLVSKKPLLKTLPFASTVLTPVLTDIGHSLKFEMAHFPQIVDLPTEKPTSKFCLILNKMLNQFNKVDSSHIQLLSAVKTYASVQARQVLSTLKKNQKTHTFPSPQLSSISFVNSSHFSKLQAEILQWQNMAEELATTHSFQTFFERGCDLCVRGTNLIAQSREASADYHSKSVEIQYKEQRRQRERLQKFAERMKKAPQKTYDPKNKKSLTGLLDEIIKIQGASKLDEDDPIDIADYAPYTLPHIVLYINHYMSRYGDNILAKGFVDHRKSITVNSTLLPNSTSTTLANSEIVAPNLQMLVQGYYWLSYSLQIMPMIEERLGLGPQLRALDVLATLATQHVTFCLSTGQRADPEILHQFTELYDQLDSQWDSTMEGIVRYVAVAKARFLAGLKKQYPETWVERSQNFDKLETLIVEAISLRMSSSQLGKRAAMNKVIDISNRFGHGSIANQVENIKNFELCTRNVPSIDLRKVETLDWFLQLPKLVQQFFVDCRDRLENATRDINYPLFRISYVCSLLNLTDTLFANQPCCSSFGSGIDHALQTYQNIKSQYEYYVDSMITPASSAVSLAEMCLKNPDDMVSLKFLQANPQSQHTAIVTTLCMILSSGSLFLKAYTGDLYFRDLIRVEELADTAIKTFTEAETDSKLGLWCGYILAHSVLDNLSGQLPQPNSANDSPADFVTSACKGFLHNIPLMMQPILSMVQFTGPLSTLTPTRTQSSLYALKTSLQLRATVVDSIIANQHTLGLMNQYFQTKFRLIRINQALTIEALKVRVRTIEQLLAGEGLKKFEARMKALAKSIQATVAKTVSIAKSIADSVAKTQKDTGTILVGKPLSSDPNQRLKQIYNSPYCTTIRQASNTFNGLANDVKAIKALLMALLKGEPIFEITQFKVHAIIGAGDFMFSFTLELKLNLEIDLGFFSFSIHLHLGPIHLEIDFRHPERIIASIFKAVWDCIF